MKVNVRFLGMGSGWVWRGVTWPTIGCCVILKVFPGEYNGPFRVHPVPRSSSLAPEVLHFVWEDSCTALFVFPCLLIGLACLRGARVLIVSNRTWHAISWEDCLLGETQDKSTKRARSQQWFLETSRDNLLRETSIYTAPLSHCEILQIATVYSSLHCNHNQWFL